MLLLDLCFESYVRQGEGWEGCEKSDGMGGWHVLDTLRKCRQVSLPFYCTAEVEYGERASGDAKRVCDGL